MKKMKPTKGGLNVNLFFQWNGVSVISEQVVFENLNVPASPHLLK